MDINKKFLQTCYVYQFLPKIKWNVITISSLQWKSHYLKFDNKIIRWECGLNWKEILNDALNALSQLHHNFAISKGIDLSADICDTVIPLFRI